MPRPALELTPSTLAALVEALGRGASRGEAAVAGGVNERTLYRWVVRGQGEDEGPFHELAEAAKIDRLELRRIRRRAGRGRGRRRP